MTVSESALEDAEPTSILYRWRYVLISLLAVQAIWSCVLWVLFYRIILVLNRPKPKRRPQNERQKRGHLLIVLGSGGHTSEMMAILQTLGSEYLTSRFEKRTWVVSSGDAFSAERAQEMEQTMASAGTGDTKCTWNIAIVHRARKIHQPIYTTPFSALVCLWDCIQVLRGTHRDLHDSKSLSTEAIDYPDLILTNGPGTAVILILASLVLMLLGLAPINPAPGQGGAMRSIYIESWARVKTLSLSGKILRFMVGRFLVQWRGLAEVDLRKVGHGRIIEETEVNTSLLGRRIEYIGPIVA